MQLMQKLQKRFGYKEIPETAQLKLSSLMQGTEEIMEEWADRVFQLALRAYEGLPEHYMLNQAIKRICHGCKDKDAGQFAINQHPDNIEETIDHLKSFQYNHQAIYGKVKKEVRKVSLCEEETENSVCSHKDDFIQLRSVKVDVTHRLSKRNINVRYERYYEENGSTGKRAIIKSMSKASADAYNFKVTVTFGS